MADSIRKQVVDSIAEALSASTGTNTVSTNLKSWGQYSAYQFPIATVIDRDTDIERLSFRHDTNDDKTATMMVTVRGYVFDKGNILDVKRTNLIRDIQKTIETGSPNMTALIFDIMDNSIETDEGLIDNYSIFDIMYDITYHYNHVTP